MARSEISVLAANPKQVFGADIWAFVWVAVITVSAFFAFMVVGIFPLWCAAVGIPLYGIAASLTAWDPFWVTRLFFFHRRLGRTKGQPIGCYRYPAG